MYGYKNREGKIIIITHLDERNGIPYANSLYQKGFENVYLLSGGIEGFLQDYCELVEGKKVPVTMKKEKKNKVIYKRSNYLDPSESGDFHIKNKNFGEEENIASITGNSVFKKNSFSVSKTSHLSQISQPSKTSFLNKSKQESLQ